MIRILEVNSKETKRAFASYSNKLYQNNPYYVPDLVFEQMRFFDSKYNPAFEFCISRQYLAYDDQKRRYVGRVGAIINHKSNRKWNQKYVRFTCFDFEDDIDISSRLIEAVSNWAKEQGMDALHGPLGFTDLDHQGMLVEGFDELDLYITFYNAPYYAKHMEALGFMKDVDWIECQLRLDGAKAERLSKIAEHVANRSSFKLVDFHNKKDILPWAKQVFELYNRAYAPLYGMTDLSESQIDAYIKSFFGFVNPDFIKVVVDSANKLAGFSIAMPSLSKAMQLSRGNLFPFGFLPILRAIKHSEVLDLYLIAVAPEYQNSGINALMLNSVMSTARRYGMTHAETGPMLEENHKVQAQWKFFDVRQHRRRRVYVKKIDN